VWIAPEIALKGDAPEFLVIADGLHFPQVFLLHGEGLTLDIADFAARWSLLAGSSGGNKKRKVGSSDPFLAGKTHLYRPVSAGALVTSMP
jgi:hypothetical protein